MRTYSTTLKLSDAARAVIADRRASHKVLLAIASGHLPVEVVANGVRYVVSGARSRPSADRQT